MEGDQRFEFRQVTTHLRPPRVAVLLHRDIEYWRRGCLSILEWTSRIWGGRYVPIVPTNGESIQEPFWEILETFDPDLVYRYEPTCHDVEDADEERYSNIVDEWIRENIENEGEVTDAQRTQYWEQFRSLTFEETSISESLRDEVKERLNPFHREENVVRMIKGRGHGTGPHLTEIAGVVPASEMEDICLLEFSDLPEEAKLLAESVAGRLSSKILSQLGGRGIEPEIQSVVPSNFDTVVSAMMEGSAPNDQSLHSITNLHCTSARRADALDYEEPVVIVAGSTLEDFCLYRSLQSIKAHTFWLPESALAAEPEKNGEEAMVSLRGNLARDIFSPSSHYRSHRHVGDQLRITSESLSRDKMQKVVQMIQSDLFFDESDLPDEADVSLEIDDLLGYRHQVFESGNVDHRSQMQFNRGVSVESVDTPKPDHFKNILRGPEKLSWITDLEIENYHLPQHPEFGPDTLHIRHYNTEWVRVTQNGFSYYCPHHTHLGGKTLDQILARPRLHVRPSIEVVGALFERGGYEVQLSDKGDFQEQARARLGGFEKLCTFLRRDGFRELLDRYTKVENSTEEQHFVYLNGRAYASFKGIEGAVGEGTVGLIDEMVNLGVVQRGIALWCRFCRNADWYGLSKLSQSFECSRCGEEQRIQHEHWKNPPDGPEWFFKLDEIIYQFYDQNTHVTPLALSALKDESRSFIHVPEIALCDKGGGDGPDVEIDICAIVDGGLVVGEASVSADKSKNEIDKYLRVADKFDAHTVVFATLAESWSPDLKQYATSQTQGSSQNFRFLERKNLL